MDLTDRIIEGLEKIRSLEQKLSAKQELIQKLIPLIIRPHNECGEDEFYSCEFIKQMSDGLCNCGADEHNIKITLLLKKLND